MIEKMGRMMNMPKHIRNICTSAHIHHGKTAFTDNLLAASGLMAEKFAGDLDKGMVTWQHADEQERLLTVDAANVSMVHEYHGEEYLINLIDTPGHIDFGGNVTRAMRAIDGTIVIVCASEGIMPQTETVLKQALRERVKPVLFINKVDRLINEMLFTPEQIQERLIKIILEFNKLIDEIAEKDYKKKWQVNIQDGSVAFGSARENWALSLPFMQKKNVTFKDILVAYKLPAEEKKKWFWEKSPLHEVILDMAINHLPDPLESQKYRIPKIWRGDIDSEMGKSLINCDPNGKLAFCITRITIEPKSGKEISAGRLYSGTFREGTTVYINNIQQPQRIQNVYMYIGIKPQSFPGIPAGNVLAISGLQGYAGDTITESPDEQSFEELKHIFEPVITKSIEVTKPQDLPKLIDVLKKVAKEDPSIKITLNEESGENLMSGMGELHLEIVENRIKTEKGLQVKTSDPIVIYRETITKKSSEVEGKTPNKHNKFYFYVEPLEPAIAGLIKKGELPETRFKKKDLEVRDKLVETGMDSKTALSVKNIYKGNILMEQTRGLVHIGEVMEMVHDMFEDVMDSGPLAKEPCIGVKVVFTDAKLHEDAIHRGPAQVYPAVREGIRGAMMQARSLMFEPYQIIDIEAPADFMGDLSKLVSMKRGQLLDMKQEGSLVIIKAKMPVAELLGWSSDLRSATNGRGSSSLIDQMFEKVPEELQDKAIRSIRNRKGLTDAMVGA